MPIRGFEGSNDVLEAGIQALVGQVQEHQPIVSQDLLGRLGRPLLLGDFGLIVLVAIGPICDHADRHEVSPVHVANNGAAASQDLIIQVRCDDEYIHGWWERQRLQGILLALLRRKLGVYSGPLFLSGCLARVRDLLHGESGNLAPAAYDCWTLTVGRERPIKVEKKNQSGGLAEYVLPVSATLSPVLV